VAELPWLTLYFAQTSSHMPKKEKERKSNSTCIKLHKYDFELSVWKPVFVKRFIKYTQESFEIAKI
jgi:hypothetical protein